MAEPEETQAIDWFWWESCQIFSKWGVFSEMLRDMGLQEANSYVPVQFLINGEPKTQDLVKTLRALWCQDYGCQLPSMRLCLHLHPGKQPADDA